MNIYVQYVLIGLAIGLVIASLILRLCKQKTLGNAIELAGVACFIAFSSQYAYWLISLDTIDPRGVAELLLFFFSIIVGVYRFLFAFVFPKR